MEKTITINGKDYNIRIPGMWHAQAGGHMYWWIMMIDGDMAGAPIYRCTRDGRIGASLADDRHIDDIITLPEPLLSARAMLDFVMEHVEELIAPIF